MLDDRYLVRIQGRRLCWRIAFGDRCENQSYKYRAHHRRGQLEHWALHEVMLELTRSHSHAKAVIKSKASRDAPGVGEQRHHKLRSKRPQGPACSSKQSATAASFEVSDKAQWGRARRGCGLGRPHGRSLRRARTFVRSSNPIYLLSCPPDIVF